MKLISHRGNLKGKNPNRENSPSYIDEAIALGYEVEIDVWVEQNLIFLGHDAGNYYVDLEWLEVRKSKLWLHAKNKEALIFFMQTDFNFFFHDSDLATITSKGYVWVFPGQQPIPSHAQNRPVPRRKRVVVARMLVLAKVRSKNQCGSVESYHVSRQSRVSCVRRARCVPT